MKKVLALLAIAGFVACNNAETKESTADSLKRVDSIAKAQKDSVDKAADTAKAHIDTAKNAAKDTIKAHK
jgi:hypothetical protein